MNISEKELQIENEHLTSVINTIKDIIDSKNINIENYKKEITKSKKFLWQNLNDYSEVEMYSTIDEEDHKVNIINKDIVKVYKLYRSLEAPYFSRVDFKSNGKSESFYIGLTGIDVDYEPIVYDWRANVSNLYYNYGLGESKYENELGTVEGVTTKKRQFDIKLGKINHVFDSSIATRDELLEETLKNNTSEYMKNIVGTIGREQNEIIRFSSKNNMVVEGVAGSGKTSIALHRIAYLLYNQKSLTNKNVLIFSPSDKFSEYISNVLPELGEENVVTTTFKDLVEQYTKMRKSESLLEFVSRSYNECTKKENDAISKKLSYEYKIEIDKYLNEYFKSLKFTKKIGLKKTFLMASELNSLKNGVPNNLSFSDKIDYLSEKICSKFKISEVKNAEKMKTVIKKVLCIPNDSVELYENYSGLELDSTIKYEDTLGLLYLYFQVHGYPECNHIAHVVIDEAQDYSLWQFEIIKSIFRGAVFTILGDNNQSINLHLKYNSLEEISSVFKNSKYMKLNKAYRSSKKIVEYTNEMIGAQDVIAVRDNDNGFIEEMMEADLKNDLEKVIDKFRNYGYKKIGIITKSESEKTDIQKFNLGVDVVTVYASKGLEYDAVIVYTTKENAYKKEEKNLLYVASTRALHSLVIINQLI